jgi:F0F1-type ATP synthase membrane subunit c/vacuolar-type H+-ATPase subunit K
MSKWHEKSVAKVGLRIAGMALLASAWAETNALRDLVKATATREATAPEMLLAGFIFISVSAGMALLIIGGGLWKPVPLSARWARRAPVGVSRDLEAALLAMMPPS